MYRMEYTRQKLSTSASNESKKITLIWANDGWCYVPQLKMRRRFTETHYTQEDWNGIIAIPQHIETIEWVLYSKAPLVWSENNEIFSEVT
jgi:hypothetical protein